MLRKAKAVWQGTGRDGSGALTTEAAISLDSKDGGFTITKSALTLTAKVPGLDQAKFDELAGVAEKTCPVSKILNAEITLDATLQ